MTLRQRVALIVGIAACTLLLLVYLTARLILLESFVQLEQQDTRRNLERAANALGEQIDYLDATTTDWAHWDDTYTFIQDRNPDYIDANLTDETFANLGLNLMVFADDSGQIVFGKAFDLLDQQETSLPAGLDEHLTREGLLLVNGTVASLRQGIIMLPDGPLLVAARPVLTSAKQGPSHGTLIFGHKLDDAQIARLAESTRLSLALFSWDDPDLASEVRTARAALSEESSTAVRPLNGDTVAGYARLTDIYNRPVLILQTDLPRQIYAQGKTTLNYFMIGVLALGVFFGVLLLFLLEKTVAAEAQMGALLEHSSDVIILTRPDGTIQQVNSAFQRMFGSTNPLPTGQPLPVLFDTELAPQITEALGAVVQKREDRQIDVTTGRNGSRLNASAALSPIRSSSGQLSGVLCSLRDISAHKRLESQLRQMLAREMELSEMRSRLISVVSHELRTPLASIQLADELLANYSTQMTDKQKLDKLDQIKMCVRQMSDLIEDILALSRTETGRLKLELSYFDLVELCQMTIENIRASVTHSHTFTFTHQQACTDVYLDQRLLKLIVSNLLSNAVKYSPPDSTIYIDLKCEDDQTTVMKVRDEGIGIPFEDQSRLFEPFFRAHNAETITGTGLGLVIVKQAVEVHGGTITFASQVGSGTTFTLTFPYVGPKADTRPVGDSAARALRR